MKKLASIVLIIISVLTIGKANALETKLFIGGNIALNSVAWSNQVEKELKDNNLNLPTSFFGLGAEAGIRLKTDGIYNPGVTLAYDYTFDSASEIKWPANQVFSSLDTGFSAISATFDNYIRFSGESSRRSDVVLGIGLASITERYDIRYTSYAHSLGLTDNKGSDDGTFVVFKLGVNFEISDKIDFYTNCRLFTPTKSGGDMDALFNLNAGVKYVF